MILVHGASSESRAFQDAVTLAGQLEAAGYPAAMLPASRPDDASESLSYEAAWYFRDPDETEFSACLITSADKADEAALLALRQARFKEGAPVAAFGLFTSRQAEIAARNRLSFSTGLCPTIENLGDRNGICCGNSGCPAFGLPVRRRGQRPGDPIPVLFAAPAIDDRTTASALNAIKVSGVVEPIIYTSGAMKTEWLNRFGPGAKIYGYTELSPSAIASMARIAVVMGDVGSNARMLSVLNTCLVSDGLIIDATESGLVGEDGMPVIRGPSDAAFIPAFLKDTVIPNLLELAEDASTSSYIRDVGVETYLDELGIAQCGSAAREERAPQIAFMPTNGVGLGHAQRCALIAHDFPEGSEKPHFFAFPSCLSTVMRYGYDATPLIPRSNLHATPSANDIVNMTRLGTVLRPGDTFVFDGGYVFPSVIRTVVRHGLKSVWIRRGLWSSAQDNRVPLDRESIFDRVIVPLEAFDSLNRSYSSGPQLRDVGPIVQELDPSKKDEVRARLAKRFGRAFDKLVVSMPGGGVAADLTMHAQAAASWAEAREDTLHLVVVWPGSKVHTALYGWTKTEVVTTHHAGLLAMAADALVSATGYNSFHEVLYNRIPAIFIPQQAAYMDDQSARAEAAAERGVAAFVPATKPGLIAPQLSRMVDGDQGNEFRKALADLELPKPGNAEAAKIIAELAS